jgi:hypothetical protein
MKVIHHLLNAIRKAALFNPEVHVASEHGGLGLDVAQDNETKNAMQLTL